MVNFSFFFHSLNSPDRNMIILPCHVEKTYSIHNGKDFVKLLITKEMLYHKLGEFAVTRITKKSLSKKRKKKVTKKSG
jgi:small subunit ribosomal protein S19